MAQITFSFTGPEADTAASTVGSAVNLAISGPDTDDPNIERNLFEIVLYEA